jgi:protein-tyrosine phosphatase
LLLEALRAVLERARAGESVEIGCVGGHGRTGTALAWLAFLTGPHAADAVAWVRAHYCPRAVETAAQERFITGLAG